MKKQQETFSQGDVVMHSIYGRGVIIPAQEEEGAVTVRFRDGSTKHFSVALAKLRKVSPNGVDEKIKQEEMSRIDYLTRQVQELTEQRNRLSAEAQKLGEQLRTAYFAREDEREKQLRDLRIRQEWQRLADTFHRQVLQALGQFPAPITTQIFEAEDWQRLDQIKTDAQRLIDECERLKRDSRIVDVEGKDYAIIEC